MDFEDRGLEDLDVTGRGGAFTAAPGLLSFRAFCRCHHGDDLTTSTSTGLVSSRGHLSFGIRPGAPSCVRPLGVASGSRPVSDSAPGSVLT